MKAQAAVHPPSTAICAPCTEFEAGEATKTAAPDRSFASMKQFPEGVAALTFCTNAGISLCFKSISVSAPPGASAFILIP